MCVFLLYVLIVLKLCIFSFFNIFLHCVIVFASFFNCVLRVRFL